MDEIMKGLNQGKCVISLLLDMTRAFKYLLLEILSDCGLGVIIMKWLIIIQLIISRETVHTNSELNRETKTYSVRNRQGIGTGRYSFWYLCK